MKRKFLLFFGFIIFLFCNIQTQASIFPHDNETNSVIIKTLEFHLISHILKMSEHFPYMESSLGVVVIKIKLMEYGVMILIYILVDILNKSQVEMIVLV